MTGKIRVRMTTLYSYLQLSFSREFCQKGASTGWNCLACGRICGSKRLTAWRRKPTFLRLPCCVEAQATPEDLHVKTNTGSKSKGPNDAAPSQFARFYICQFTFLLCLKQERGGGTVFGSTKEHAAAVFAGHWASDDLDCVVFFYCLYSYLTK